MPPQIPTANIILTSDYSKIKYYASRSMLKVDKKDKNTFMFTDDNLSNLLNFEHKTMPGKDGAGDSHQIIFDIIDPQNVFEETLLSNNLDKQLPAKMSESVKYELALRKAIEEAEHEFEKSQSKIMKNLKHFKGGHTGDYDTDVDDETWGWKQEAHAERGLQRYTGDKVEGGSLGRTSDTNWGRAAYHMARSIRWRGFEANGDHWTYKEFGNDEKGYIETLKKTKWFKDLKQLSDRIDNLKSQVSGLAQSTLKKQGADLSLQQRTWYLSYGVGNDFRTWAGPFSVKMVRLGYDYSAKSAPVIKITMAGMTGASFDQDWDLAQGLPTEIKGLSPRMMAPPNNFVQKCIPTRISPHEVITIALSNFIKNASSTNNVVVLLPDLPFWKD